MKIIVSADDYGLTRGVTDTILESVDHGAVTRTSIIANGDAFDYAVTEAKARPHLEIALHLNLTDGLPCAPITHSALVSSAGKFCHEFLGLWTKYILTGSKNQLHTEIKNEIRAQMRRVQAALPDHTISLNGHDHVHLIPHVSRALMEVVEELNIKYVRLTPEPFFVDTKTFSLNFFSGIIKHVLLNLLSKNTARLLKEKNVDTPDAFVGILYTGKMTVRVVRQALTKILKKSPPPKIIEILFHPGAVTAAEKNRWPNNSRSQNWFFSRDRRSECLEACSPELKIFLKQN